MQPALEAFPPAGRPIHETGDAAVVHVDLTPDGPREREALGWLDARERSRREKFLYPRPRREFTLCRAALRSLLCRELGCGNAELSFETAKFGKPFARVGGDPAPVAFNVSHSGRHGLIALSPEGVIALAPEGRIGVDVEERSTKRNLDGYIRLVFAPKERTALEKSRGREKVELFYRLWTLKEAAIKAVGAGLSIDPAGHGSGRKDGGLQFSPNSGGPVASRKYRQCPLCRRDRPGSARNSPRGRGISIPSPLGTQDSALDGTA